MTRLLRLSKLPEVADVVVDCPMAGGEEVVEAAETAELRFFDWVVDAWPKAGTAEVDVAKAVIVVAAVVVAAGPWVADGTALNEPYRPKPENELREPAKTTMKPRKSPARTPAAYLLPSMMIGAPR